MEKFLSVTKKYLSIIFEFLKHFFNHLIFKWQEEQNYIQFCNNASHWNYVSSLLQDELFFILKNSPYGFLNYLFCSDDISNGNWSIRENTIIYHYDVFADDPPSDFALRQIRQKLNIKIGQYQQQFIRQYGYEQTALLYPCIYYGMYIMSIKKDGTMIHFELASHLSQRTP